MHLLACPDHLVVTQRPGKDLLNRVIDSGLPVVNLIAIPELSNQVVARADA